MSESGTVDQAAALHPFDEALQATAETDGGWAGKTSAAYANMVGPYGGIMAAQALSAVLRHDALLGEPVALTVNFCAAMADGPFVALARPVRTNRSTQHWSVELQQQGQAVVTATAITALRRETWGVAEVAMPMVNAPQDTAPPPGQGRVPWIHRYEFRFIQGGIPADWDGSADDTSLSRLWVRDQPPRPLDFASLTAMSDVFFPRIWRRRARLTPLGTVSMTVYFHADATQLRDTGTGYLLGQAQAQAFHNGYFDQTAQLWNEAGKLLVTTHQLVYFKE